MTTWPAPSLRVLAAAGCLMATCVAGAPTNGLRAVEEYLLPESDRVDGPLVVMANLATVAGTASDDVFVFAGQQAELSGACLNDAWVLAQTVVAKGVVHDHARLAGYSVTISGVVSGGVVAAGNAVTVAREARLHGNTYLAGENVICEGVVEGPVRIAARRVTVGGNIRGNVDLTAEDIVIMPGAVIQGDLSYLSAKELLPGKSVTIEGTLTRRQIETPSEPRPFLATGNLLFSLMLFLAACAVGIPFVVIFPAYAGRAATQVRDFFFRSAFVGALACCLLPMIGVMAAVSLIGLPLGLSLLAVFGLLSYFAKFAVGLAVGTMVLRRGVPRERGAFWIMLLGLVLLYLGGLLPIIGPAITLAAAFLGTGGLLLGLGTGGGARREEVPPPLPQDSAGAEPPKV
jgi:cytoskeletal protein CcmA (bactofilin family)